MQNINGETIAAIEINVGAFNWNDGTGMKTNTSDKWGSGIKRDLWLLIE